MKILAFPRDANPYQELLYAPMRQQGNIIDYLEGPTTSHSLNLLLLPLVLMRKRLQGYDTIHVHWTFPFCLPWAGVFGRITMQYWAAVCWIIIRCLGYQLVWTAHNTKPHERWFWNDDKAHRFLARLCHKIIIHTTGARQQLEAMGISNSRLRHIPHGSYIGTYPDTITRTAARQQIGLTLDTTVILFFGQIRPYKGVEALLTAFASLPNETKLTLLVAGSPKDAALQRRLEDAAARNTQLRLTLKHIADEDMQIYFRAADFTVLPYEHATTSGVALLACSFGSPLITPDQPAFKDIPQGVQLQYRPGELSAALTKATTLPLSTRSQMSQAATTYARELTWPVIATKTLAYLMK